MTVSDCRHRALALPPLPPLPPLPRLATPSGFDLLNVGEGLQPVATLATCFKKVFEIEQLRESFSILGGKGGKTG
jgi:hypothetical protein